MARTVVEFTGDPGYTRLLREVFERTPVHLIAGERSRSSEPPPEFPDSGSTRLSVWKAR
jgi:hypothetical protein